jgi:hypothetical protein
MFMHDESPFVDIYALALYYSVTHCLANAFFMLILLYLRAFHTIVVT